MMDIVGAYIIVDGSNRNPQSSLIIQVTISTTGYSTRCDCTRLHK